MWLTSVLACPLVGMLLVLCLPRRSVRAIRAVALASTTAALLLTLRILGAFQPHATTVQFQERLPTSPGTYEFRYLPNNGYTDVARSNSVTVQ